MFASLFLLMTLFLGLPLAIRGNSQSSHIIRPRNERWRIIDGTDDIVIDHTTLTVLLDSRCAGPRRGRSSRMDHEVGVCCCEPRRCLRLELVDVSTCAQRNRVAGVCKLAEEGEGRREGAAGRGESGCNELVASGPYCIFVSLDLAVGAVLEAVFVSTRKHVEGDAASGSKGRAGRMRYICIYSVLRTE